MPIRLFHYLDRDYFLGYTFSTLAEVAELADAHDSNSCSLGIVGSIPTFGIFNRQRGFFYIMKYKHK